MGQKDRKLKDNAGQYGEHIAVLFLVPMDEINLSEQKRIFDKLYEMRIREGLSKVKELKAHIRGQ